MIATGLVVPLSRSSRLLIADIARLNRDHALYKMHTERGATTRRCAVGPDLDGVERARIHRDTDPILSLRSSRKTRRENNTDQTSILLFVLRIILWIDIDHNKRTNARNLQDSPAVTSLQGMSHIHRKMHETASFHMKSL